jgi:hypothetical protein
MNLMRSGTVALGLQRKFDDKENMIVKVAATLQNFGFSHPL